MRIPAAAAAGVAAALVLGGCSAVSSGPTARTLTAATSHGLTYELKVTDDGGKQCTTATYRTATPDGRPILQGAHSCGPPALPGHPVLVQARLSRQSIVIDVAASACSTVRVGRTPATLRPAVSRCTAGAETRFRATVLPPARRLLIHGIPGIPVVNFPRHICRMGLCITPLA